MKYDSSIVELKNLLPTAKNILIALPTNSGIDKLASALALFLTLEAQGKQVSVVCDDDIKVASSYLFGIDHIQKTLPSTDGGNLTITLENVAASDNTVPALEKLDWFAENNNLNLVFHVLPGQTFQPARIMPHYQGSGFNLIFVIGAVNLNALGNVYQANSGSFSGAHIVNIDTQVVNTSFGQTNVLDPNASSVSEIMTNLIADLGINLDADSASNLLAGIFEATDNLANSKMSADSYMAVANCLRVGGRKPQSAASIQPQAVQSQSQAPSYDWSALMPKDHPQQPSIASVVNMQPQEYTVPPIVNYQDIANTSQVNQSQPVQPIDVIQPSPEERPAGEGVVSETPEPDWLTPKIFKGTSLG